MPPKSTKDNVTKLETVQHLINLGYLDPEDIRVAHKGAKKLPMYIREMLVNDGSPDAQQPASRKSALPGEPERAEITPIEKAPEKAKTFFGIPMAEAATKTAVQDALVLDASKKQAPFGLEEPTKVGAIDQATSAGGGQLRALKNELSKSNLRTFEKNALGQELDQYIQEFDTLGHHKNKGAVRRIEEIRDQVQKELPLQPAAPVSPALKRPRKPITPSNVSTSSNVSTATNMTLGSKIEDIVATAIDKAAVDKASSGDAQKFVPTPISEQTPQTTLPLRPEEYIPGTDVIQQPDSAEQLAIWEEYQQVEEPNQEPNNDLYIQRYEGEERFEDVPYEVPNVNYDGLLQYDPDLPKFYRTKSIDFVQPRELRIPIKPKEVFLEDSRKIEGIGFGTKNDNWRELFPPAAYHDPLQFFNVLTSDYDNTMDNYKTIHI